MTLDRWIAVVILMLCSVYAYTAWFAMDDVLPPILRRNPVWPSSFPKILSILGILLALLVVLGAEKPSAEKTPDIDYRNPGQYHWGQAFGLIALMVAYAFALRPIGFLASTFLFLVCGAALLGERRWILMAVVAAIAAGGIWYLVDAVLGIFLRPLPAFL